MSEHETRPETMLDPTIIDGWNAYTVVVIPPTAGPHQRRQMRRAFYAGVAWLLGICGEISEIDAIDEQSGARMLSKIAAELEDYSDDVAGGRA